MSKTTTIRPGFMRRNLWALLTTGVLLLACTGAAVQQLTWVDETAEQQSHIEDLSEQLKHQQAKNIETDDANTYAALGVTESRLRSDALVINDVLDVAFTWSDGQSYAEARDTLIRHYDLAEDGDFLTTFMPEAGYSVVGGEREPYIDAVGLVFTLQSDPEIDAVRVEGTSYEYVVLADVKVTSSAVTPGASGEQPSEIRRMLLHMTIDDQGEISNFSGVPPSGSTRSSR